MQANTETNTHPNMYMCILLHAHNLLYKILNRTVGSEDAYDTLIGFFNWCGISPSFCDVRTFVCMQP